MTQELGMTSRRERTPNHVRIVTWIASAGCLLGLLGACGGSAPPPPPASTPDAQARAATATADADRRASAVAWQGTYEAEMAASATAVEESLPPCLVDAETVAVIDQVGAQLYDQGMALARSDATEGMRLVELGNSYRILADCREEGSATPTSDGRPGACLAGVEFIQRLRRNASDGLGMALTALMTGDASETMEAFFSLNELLLERANALMIDCGFEAGATPVGSPVATPMGSL
jgi:hypothetical protein